MLQNISCHFLKTELEYLGHIIGGEVIRVNPRKIETVVDWEAPKTISIPEHFRALQLL